MLSIKINRYCFSILDIKYYIKMSKNARKLEITFDHKITISILYKQEKPKNFFVF